MAQNTAVLLNTMGASIEHEERLEQLFRRSPIIRRPPGQGHRDHIDEARGHAVTSDLEKGVCTDLFGNAAHIQRSERLLDPELAGDRQGIGVVVASTEPAASLIHFAKALGGTNPRTEAQPTVVTGTVATSPSSRKFELLVTSAPVVGKGKFNPLS